MKTNEFEQALTQFAVDWLQTNDPLTVGETVNINVIRSLTPPIRVEVIVQEALVVNEQEKIDRAVDRAGRFRSWLRYALEELGITTIVQLQALTVDDFFRYRNVGYRALSEFARALRECGIDCPWMEHASRPPTLSQVDLEGCVRCPLKQVDWDKMQTAMSLPEMHDSAIYSRVIHQLMRAQNLELSMRDILRNSPRPRRYRTYRKFILKMNIRFRALKLPYRVSFVPEPHLSRFDGKVAIVMKPS